MTESNMTTSLRCPSAQVCTIDINGVVNSYAETALMSAYTEASQSGAKAIILNFTGLEYMNSSGIGLLVTLLIRVQRQKQRLFAYGLSDHYKQIFELTRLNEAIRIFEDEKTALAALGEP